MKAVSDRSLIDAGINGAFHRLIAWRMAQGQPQQPRPVCLLLWEHVTAEQEEEVEEQRCLGLIGASTTWVTHACALISWSWSVAPTAWRWATPFLPNRETPNPGGFIRVITFRD